MDRYAVLKEKLAKREKVVMANVMLMTSPLLMDAFAAADCVLLDKEHGVYGTEELIPLTMRCRALGLPTIIRVEDSVYHLIAKAIDLGGDGIMVPRTETVEQLKTAVDAIRFAPVGRTGYGGWGILRPGETVETCQRLLLPQIESPKGLKQMPEMIERFGEHIDGFIIGPNDLSIMLGVPKQLDHPSVVEHIQMVFDVCKQYRMSCGCYAKDMEHARLYAKMGANIFWIGDDRTYIRKGLGEYVEGIAEI